MAASTIISRSISGEAAPIPEKDTRSNAGEAERDNGGSRLASGESCAHRRLKELTFLWAYQRGYRCCAMEVRAPRSPYRVDVAGVRFDRNLGISTVGVFECKRSRTDLLRDNRRRDELREKLLRLQERRKRLE